MSHVMTPGALTRFRVMAWVTGVMLLVLVLVAVPLRYLGGEESMSRTVSPIHGFLYIVYVVVTIDLGSRMRWNVKRTVLMLLAGTVPFASFFAERAVVREVAGRADPAAVVGRG
ncbi:MAG: DUF3817 domain-containing protein [Actinomycetes bacterium]